MIYSLTTIKELCDTPLGDNVWRKLIKDFNYPLNYLDHKTTMSQLIVANRCDLTQGTGKMIKWAHLFSTWPSQTQDRFMQAVNEAMDAIVTGLTSTTEYQHFSECDISKILPLTYTNIPNGDIYQEQNVGKTYISIDLKEAAFKALCYWNDKVSGGLLPSGCRTYKELAQFHITDIPVNEHVLLDYLMDSKQIRQVIFGKTNPKRIQHIERFMVQQLVEMIEQLGNLIAHKSIIPVKLNNDEAIYECTPEMEDIVKSLYNATKEDWHITKFTLKEYKLIQSFEGNGGSETSIFPTDPVFVKDCLSLTTTGFENSVPSFKCLPTRYALAFETLYREYTGRACDTARLFDAGILMSTPVKIDGLVAWFSNEKTTWEIEEILGF